MCRKAPVASAAPSIVNCRVSSSSVASRRVERSCALLLGWQLGDGKTCEHAVVMNCCISSSSVAFCRMGHRSHLCYECSLKAGFTVD